jgi:penicillin-binding protein 1A
LARRRRRLSAGAIVVALAVVTVALGTGSDSPGSGGHRDPLEPLLDYRPPLASVVTDRHGRVIGQFFVQRRRLVRLDDVPEHVIQAFVASEDGRFFQHAGLDIPAILRAAWTNLRGGRIEQGASTITQQMVKNVLLTPERTWSRKLREIRLALEVERRLDKHEILLIYMNHVYLGNGSYGIGDAARSYFGKDVSDLDLSEAALLAGLPQRPSAYSPVRHPEAADARRRYVLGQMLERGLVTPETYREALARRPRISHTLGTRSPDFAASFVEEVRRELVDRFGAARLYRAGLTIETTLDLDLQRAAYGALRGGLEALDRRQGWRGPVRRVAPEELEEALAEIGRENRWSRGVPPPDLADERTPWLGLVLESETDARGRELARVGLAPGIVVRAEVEPAAWGLRPARPGPETRLLHSGDVAHFRIRPLPGSGTADLYQEPLVEGALLSLDVASGDVLAMVGGYDFRRSEFNRAVQARRQPGSAFKPFVYAAAIEAGYTQASFVLDTPNLLWDPSSQSTWRPHNYGRRFLGWLTLRRALAKSVNNATIQLARRVGIEPVVAMARRLGVRSRLSQNFSLALGTSGVSLLELTRAYAVFPAGGKQLRTRLIRRVLDREGDAVVELAALDGFLGGTGDSSSESNGDGGDDSQAVSRPVARVVTDLLQGAVSEPGATGRGAKPLGRAVAGKTGTTNGNRDAWFVGFSPDVAAGVWVGFDRPRSLGRGETGGRAALPIWVDYMSEVLTSRPPRDFDMPEGIVFSRVNPRSGRRVLSAGSRHASWQAFVVGTEPPPASRRSRELRRARRELMLDAF